MTQTVEDFIEHYGVKGMRWGRRKARGSRSTERTVYNRSPKKLTSAELDKRIKRMETEKRYNELNRKDVSRGSQLAHEILTNSGRTVATTIVTGAVLFGVKKALEAKLGAGAASAITKRGK